MIRSTINKILALNCRRSKDWNSRKSGGDHTLVKANSVKILDLILGIFEKMLL
jgi:hypothetical protein